jgi:hypothetical protein
MTTVKELYAEAIFLKGEPITSLNGGSNNTNITNVQNNITNINGLISGLFGGDPVDNVVQRNNIQSRVPNINDDINENWSVGSIWITSTQGFVCMDNAERNAVWKVALLEIDDTRIDIDSTFSSQKIGEEIEVVREGLQESIDLKANQSTTYTKEQMDFVVQMIALRHANENYTRTAINTFLDLKADKTFVDNKHIEQTTTTDDLQSQINVVQIESLQEFPTYAIGPLESNPNSLTVRQGDIIVSGSSVLPSYFTPVLPYKAFNKVQGAEQGWLSSNGFYGANFTTFTNGNTLSVKSGQTSTHYTLYRTKVDGAEVGKQKSSKGFDCISKMRWKQLT